MRPTIPLPKTAPVAAARVSRRVALAAGATAAGLAGVGLLSPRTTEASALTAPTFSPVNRLGRTDRIFLEYGMQHLAWVAAPGSVTPYGAAYNVPSAEQFLGGGFTAPSFYTSGPEGRFGEALASRTPAHAWGAAIFPYGGPIEHGPLPGENTMTAEMQKRASSMLFACFGDEEMYSDDRVLWLRDHFAAHRAIARNCLVYNNQAINTWSDDQMRHYIQTARPDLISFDFYYFQPKFSYPTGSCTTLYNQSMKYRNLAQEGLDGQGAKPIGWAQYSQGFQSATGAKYILSQSQISIVSSVSWALGAKMLNLFRYHWVAGSPTAGVLNNQDGSVTPQYHDYAVVNAHRAALSPYLTRLRNTSVGMIRGKGLNAAGQVVPNRTSLIPDWSPQVTRPTRIAAVKVQNLTPANNGLPGDLIISQFDTLPGMTAAQAAGRVGPATTGFMLVNALALPKHDTTDLNGAGGGWDDTMQRVTLHLNIPTSATDKRLVRIEPATGREVTVPLTPLPNGKHSMSIDLGGGLGVLFLWR